MYQSIAKFVYLLKLNFNLTPPPKNYLVVADKVTEPTHSFSNQLHIQIHEPGTSYSNLNVVIHRSLRFYRYRIKIETAKKWYDIYSTIGL